MAEPSCPIFLWNLKKMVLKKNRFLKLYEKIDKSEKLFLVSFKIPHNSKQFRATEFRITLKA